MSKITLDEITTTLAAEHWQLISDIYKNLDTEMTFECPEGHRVFAPWKKLRTKLECPICKQNNLVSQNQTVLPKSVGARRVLALDQASHVTGYAVFDNDKLIKCGTFNTELNDEIARCAMVKTWLISMINNWKPDFIAIEGFQFQDESSGQKMGITVFQTLARLQGVLLNAIYEAKIPYEICSTNTWRHYCGVKGKTRTDKKRSMQLLVKQWYDFSASDDESDAIGIGRYVLSIINKNTKVENWEE